MLLQARRAALTLGLCLIALPAAACIWDSNTLRDELQTRGLGLFELITGQVPHHGERFYEAQAQRARARLKAAPEDLTAGDDLVGATVKLGLFEEARATLDNQLAKQPKRYESLSNLGVLLKKQGDFPGAARAIARALEQKPEGHMGLGDWYLRMLRYQAAKAAGRPWKGSTFLSDDDEAEESWAWTSTPFSRRDFSVPSSPGEALDLEQIIELCARMIRNDERFPGSYVLLGQALEIRFDLNLAFWSYARALELGCEDPEGVEAAMAKIHAHWTEAAGRGYDGVGKSVEDLPAAHARVRDGFAAAARWRAQFEAAEAGLIAKAGSGEVVEFAAVEAELARRGITKQEPRNVGVVQAAPSGPTFVLLILAALGLWLYRNALRRRRRAA